MKAVAAVLAILLFAAAATAQEVGAEVGDQLEGEVGAGAAPPSRRYRVHGASADVLASAPIVGGGGYLIGGRKMLEARTLLGTDGDGTPVTINTTANTYSKIGKYCSTDNELWGTIDKYNATLFSVYGDLVHDASICKISAAGKGKVVTSNNATGLIYGGTAQDFGSTRPNWESYGWSLFKLTNPPDSTYGTDVKVQGIQLHLIGNVGLKHTSGVTCSVKGISLAIYNASQTAPYDPIALNYTKTIWLNGSGETTFTWSTNKTAILYTDIAPSPDAYPTFSNGTYHWLRIKIIADFTGTATGAQVGQCYAFWGMSSTVANDVNVRSRWQEVAGGSQGFSTSCLGAATSGAAGGSIPGQYQTWWNCWNNGLNTLTGNTGRRCSTYRSTVNPAIPSADCLDATNRARFNDYNYAFTGHQAQLGVGGNNDGEAGIGGGPDLSVQVP